MKAPIARFLSVFTLVSRVPVRLTFEADFSRTDFWLPLVGVPASAVALAGFGAASLAFPDPLLAAIGALFVQYLAFNLFHVDGLLDTADAMTGHLAPERRLEILKDSRIGAYAFFFGFFALAAKVAALAALVRSGGGAAVAALLAAPVAGRTAAAIVPLRAPPARPTGLGALMRGFAPRRAAAGFALASAPLAASAMLTGRYAMYAVALGASAAGALAAGFGLARLYRRRAGGFTGDALGAAVEAGELLVLLALAALLPRLGGLA
ncbi:MAG: adenosylcobinamide-GDP ribazoletransferase [Spirochaetaceae bacterium]|nr:adenosylcobinamide-GDP ribazoletransferase [Spirochaetaceae bacterium]